ncbi:hypothetical protein KIS4809_2954 [Bacillus sp. ZZV12-4809]|nr:hypothetical protein KIS4809_2954 [Bacillus sp. ZZV12-4809]
MLKRKERTVLKKLFELLFAIIVVLVDGKRAAAELNEQIC